MTQGPSRSGSHKLLSTDLFAKIKESIKDPKGFSQDPRVKQPALNKHSLLANEKQKLDKMLNSNARLKKGDAAILPLHRFGKRAGEIMGRVGQRFPDGTVEFVLPHDKHDPLSSRLVFRVPFTALIPLPPRVQNPAHDAIRDLK